MTSRAPREAPNKDSAIVRALMLMLNIDWHPGMIGQRFAERDIFNILIKRHAMNNAIFGIDNTGHRHGDGGKAFQLLLMANKEAINMVDNARQNGVLSVSASSS